PIPGFNEQPDSMRGRAQPRVAFGDARPDGRSEPDHGRCVRLGEAEARLGELTSNKSGAPAPSRPRATRAYRSSVRHTPSAVHAASSDSSSVRSRSAAGRVSDTFSSANTPSGSSSTEPSASGSFGSLLKACEYAPRTYTRAVSPSR